MEPAAHSQKRTSGLRGRKNKCCVMLTFLCCSFSEKSKNIISHTQNFPTMMRKIFRDYSIFQRVCFLEARIRKKKKTGNKKRNRKKLQEKR
jgi:hypothetical protein